MLRLCLSMGFQMIVGGSDVGFLAGGSKAAAGEARKVIDASSDVPPSAAPDPSRAAKSIY